MTDERIAAIEAKVAREALPCAFVFENRAPCLAHPDHKVHHGKWRGPEPNHDYISSVPSSDLSWLLARLREVEQERDEAVSSELAIREQHMTRRDWARDLRTAQASLREVEQERDSIDRQWRAQYDHEAKRADAARADYLSLAKEVVGYADLTHEVVVSGGTLSDVAAAWRKVVEQARAALAAHEAAR